MAAFVKREPDPYLSPNERDLLLAALNSQAHPDHLQNQHPREQSSQEASTAERQNTMSASNDSGLFISPHMTDMDTFGLDCTPDLDYLDGDVSFDFENADLGGEMIGALPGDHNEKRKNPDEDDLSEESSAKRQETQEGEKGAKKPGRKPLTNEPTTKRKAQNRAAQRAFRERKEKHLKDLETKVSELTKSQEADKHENGLLKAQVTRLQNELREYRVRMSMQSSGARRSPTLPANSGPQRGDSNNLSDLVFDFPKFGSSPNNPPNLSAASRSSTIRSEKSTSSPVPSLNTADAERSISPRNIDSRTSASPNLNTLNDVGSSRQSFPTYSTLGNMHGFASPSAQTTNASTDALGDLFSPSILAGANANNYFDASPFAATNAQAYNVDNGGDTTAGVPGAFVFNSTSSISDTTSPSAGSSQWNAHNTNSSCDTSPEPSHDSPALKDTRSNSRSGKQPALSSIAEATQINQSSFYPSNLTSINFGSTDFDHSSLGAFDPLLFGDYRESNDAITGAGDFTGGFFDDALNSTPFDPASPSNLFGILQSPQPSTVQPSVSNAAGSKSNNQAPPSRFFMAEVERQQNGGDDNYGLSQNQSTPAHDKTKYISCNNIWSQLQSNSDFQEGKFDLDSLCSELRTKARCSESGVMIDQDHVHDALRRLAKSGNNGSPKGEVSDFLVYEKQSWDSALNKLSKNSSLVGQK